MRLPVPPQAQIWYTAGDSNSYDRRIKSALPSSRASRVLENRGGTAPLALGLKSRSRTSLGLRSRSVLVPQDGFDPSSPTYRVGVLATELQGSIGIPSQTRTEGHGV